MGRPPGRAKIRSKVVQSRQTSRTRGIPSLEDPVYKNLLLLLKGLLNIPVRERDDAVKKAYYYHYNYSKQLSVCNVEHPIFGREATERIMYTSSQGKQTILTKCNEKHKCIDFFYSRSKGDGARKLKKRIDEIFGGITENDIQQYINTSRSNQEIKAVFDNKPPLKPVTASKVWERIQIDLMSMEDVPIINEGKRYRWILSIIDVFSRYLVLRPLHSKDTALVAAELLQVFADFGTPAIIQTDRGSEFQGSVVTVAQQLNVKIIRSSVKHPQSQGKDERSHRTIRSKIRFDLLEDACKSSNEYDWVLSLPLYQTIYNTGFHRALGTSPFKVFFGREANYNLHPKMADDMSVSNEMCSNEIEAVNESSEKNEQVLKQHLDMAHTIRMKAAQKSNDADKKTIKRQSSKFPHSVYAIGDRVLVKTNKKKWNKVKGKGVATKRSSKATVVAVNPAYNKYKVKMDNTPTEIWVSVSLITSLTREKENKRMKVSGKAAPSSSKKQGYHPKKSTWLSEHNLSSHDITEHEDEASKDVMITLPPYSMTYKHFAELCNGDFVNIEVVDLFLAHLHILLKIDKNTTWIAPSNVFIFINAKDFNAATEAVEDVPESCFMHGRILLPMISSRHYLLFVVNFVNREVLVYDPLSTAKTTIQMLNQMYFIHQVLDKRKLLENNTQWNITLVQDITRQENSTDCGVYICKYAECILQDRPPKFDITSTTLRMEIAERLINGCKELREMAMVDDSEDPNESQEESMLIEVSCKCGIQLPLRVAAKHRKLCSFQNNQQDNSDLSDGDDLPVITFSKPSGSGSNRMVNDPWPQEPPPKWKKSDSVQDPDGIDFLSLRGYPIGEHSVRNILEFDWLNDNVINYYFQVLLESNSLAVRQKRTHTNIHVVPTFFYERLLKDQQTIAAVRCTTTTSRKRKHGDISHYIRGEPGDLSFILVPINISNTHWILCTIDFRFKIVKCYDSLGHCFHESTCKRLRDFANEIIDGRHDCNAVQSTSDEWQLINVIEFPEQTNSSDCGVFVCKVAQCIVKFAKLDFNPASKLLRSWLISEILHSPKQHKVISTIDESKLDEMESKAKSSGMLLEYEEDDYDSDPDLSESSDEEKIIGDIKGQILYFKKDDLLTPDITITDEEKQKMKSDITILNTREERIEMALMDVLEEYHHTRIDESKLPWPIPKIRSVVKKYEYYYRSLCECEVKMVYWRIAAKRLSTSHLGRCMKESEIRGMACTWPLLTLCPPLASEITHYLIEVSEDEAPLKSVSTHVRIATYDLIPEVMILLLTEMFDIEYDDAVLHYITQTLP